jgi:hypothetical protein
MEEKEIIVDETKRRYKVKVYKMFNPIPATLYVQTYGVDVEKMADIISEGLDGNALVFITEKGKIKSYDRTTITKVMVEEVE